MSAFATLSDLAAYLAVPEASLLPDAPRLLLRASEEIRYHCAPLLDETDPAHLSACKTATCAQVEWYMRVGEGLERLVTSRTVGRYSESYGYPPPVLAPRARRALVAAGLLYLGAEVM